MFYSIELECFNKERELEIKTFWGRIVGKDEHFLSFKDMKGKIRRFKYENIKKVNEYVKSDSAPSSIVVLSNNRGNVYIVRRYCLMETKEKFIFRTVFNDSFEQEKRIIRYIDEYTLTNEYEGNNVIKFFKG